MRASDAGRQLPVVNLADFGAIGDGFHNDTDAFRQAAAAINALGGGRLIIPKGDYIVGRQDGPAGAFGLRYAFLSPDIIAITDCRRPVVIEGNGATIRFADGLRFGTFDPITGVPKPPSWKTTDRDYRGRIGSIVMLRRNASVVVRDLVLDGNSKSYIFGGQFGDRGRQIRSDGITCIDNTDVAIENVETHHHGRDGIYIRTGPTGDAAPPAPHRLVNLRAFYNGRQGLSWTGGNGLTCTDCEFSFTGQGAVRSAPSAGIDIEPNKGMYCRNGRFVRCRFIDNRSVGFLQWGRRVRNVVCEDCTFWGTHSWAAWNRSPGTVYRDCRFYGGVFQAFGSGDRQLATRFQNCSFEDRRYRDKPSRGAYLFKTNKSKYAQNVTFEDCRFVSRGKKLFFTNGGGLRLVRCSFKLDDANFPDLTQIMTILGAHVEDCEIAARLSSPPKQGYVVRADDKTEVIGRLRLGEHIFWGSVLGPKGPAIIGQS